MSPPTPTNASPTSSSALSASIALTPKEIITFRTLLSNSASSHHAQSCKFSHSFNVSSSCLLGLLTQALQSI